MCQLSDGTLSECQKKSNSFWLKTIIVVSVPQLDPDHGEIFLLDILAVILVQGGMQNTRWSFSSDKRGQTANTDTVNIAFSLRWR